MEMDLSGMNREQREAVYKTWLAQKEMDNSTMGILDEMKRDVQEEYSRNRQSKVDRHQFAFDELVARHIQQQRDWGVGVPSSQEAMSAAEVVLERLKRDRIE